MYTKQILFQINLILKLTLKTIFQLQYSIFTLKLKNIFTYNTNIKYLLQKLIFFLLF